MAQGACFEEAKQCFLEDYWHFAAPQARTRTELEAFERMMERSERPLGPKLRRKILKSFMRYQQRIEVHTARASFVHAARGSFVHAGNVSFIHAEMLLSEGAHVACVLAAVSLTHNAMYISICIVCI